MTALEQTLTKIASGSLDEAQLEVEFSTAAQLMLNSVLVAGKERFQINEIEMYFNDKKNHADPYVHNDPKQGMFGEWYFHNLKSFDSYTHNRRGIDLTFGANSNYGGILIRGIQKVSGEKKNAINGPSKVVSEIMRSLASDIVNVESKNAFDLSNPMHLEVEYGNDKEVLKDVRFGLSDLSLEFRDKRYRFFHNISYLQGKEKVARNLVRYDSKIETRIIEMLGYKLNLKNDFGQRNP